jgi:hypothetical protein
LPKTPEFGLMRSASPLLLTLLNKDTAAKGAANAAAPATHSEQPIDSNRAAIRTAALYAAEDVDGGEPLIERREILNPNVAQASSTPIPPAQTAQTPLTPTTLLAGIAALHAPPNAIEDQTDETSRSSRQAASNSTAAASHAHKQSRVLIAAIILFVIVLAAVLGIR